jgi:RNA polymerase sigma factor (sigma-70 family)
VRRPKPAKRRERFDCILTAYMQDARRSVARARRHLSGEEPDGSDFNAKVVDLLPLGVFMAKKYRKPGFELLDLIQVANCAIIEAVREHAGSVPITTFAAHRIRWALIHEFRTNRHCISLPGCPSDRYSYPGFDRISDRAYANVAATAFDDDELGKQLLALIDAIPDDCRAVFLDRLSGATPPEIADRYSINKTTVLCREKKALLFLFSSVGVPYEGQTLSTMRIIRHENHGTRRRFFTAFGRTQSASEWCREIGIRMNTLIHRLDAMGLSPELALATPIQRKGTRFRGPSHA